MSSNFHDGKHVLITGGAGFVGSNLAHAAHKAGARVTVIDNFHPDYGGNEYNLRELKGDARFELVRGDINDQALMAELAGRADVVYHAAAQCSHVDSLKDPWLDLEYNCKGTLSMLEGVRQSSRKPVVVYAATRAIIGAALELPATERTLPNPVDIYGVNKHAAELYCSVYARVHGVPCVSLRLTNCFGPRHQMKNGKYGILNWFMSLALQGKPLKIFGTGEQLRDYLYIDDAVGSFLRAAELASRLREGSARCEHAQVAGPKIPYAVFNINSGSGIRFVDAARKIVATAGTKLEMVPWPADRAAIETGDFVADGAAATEAMGWKPATAFDEGLAKTMAYYREHLKHYLP